MKIKLYSGEIVEAAKIYFNMHNETITAWNLGEDRIIHFEEIDYIEEK
jgi:hypothetical protein